ncbi:PEP-CTERM system TPR-repeat protein PrsT [Geobacter hydrogenophilus]|uniref:Lipoprotein n=1 Tax=Geobacter hydrogenophilus TaxID=40983 RepID=A0A9W6G1Q5_9BACT|nr:XrtA/PEP-CTERM system TPR-repeat protein PrsT [Geobacter hydrogenophilus]MBT0892908.1 PEP-CTERM system TPR-repeat protein PrsT [Geobacter hydrogenophilus]GLI39259.1 lipoprotein [Geobacter hydrogenophilus]
MFNRRIALIVLVVATLSACGGKTKEELYAEAVKELDKGNANGAIVLLKNAVEKDQNYFDARYKLAKAYMAVGKFEQAEKEFQKALRQNPSNPEIRLDLAKLYNSINKPDEAIAEAKAYLSARAGSADALEVIGTSYGQKKMFDEAEKYLKESLQAEPARASAMLQLAKVYLATKREQEGMGLIDEIVRKDPKNTKAYYLAAYYEGYRGNSEKALEYYQKIMQADPDDANAAFRIGMMHISKGEADKAERLADDLIRKASKRPEGHQLKGIALYTRKNYDQAITELQGVVKNYQNPGAYYYLGLSHYQRNDLELALSQFRKVIDLNPKHLQARLMSVTVLLQQKRIDDAIAEVKRVIELDDKNAFAHNLLGSAYIAKGMTNEALKELNRAIELEPNLVDAHMKKGIVNLTRGKRAEGEEELETAVKVAPDVLNSRYMLASYYMRQNKQARAIEVLKAGLKGGKQDAPLYNIMAAAAFADKREKDGISYLQKAREVDQAYLPASFNLASYYISKKDNGRAVGLFNEILKRDPVNIKALIGLGAISESEGKAQEALAYYTKAKETKDPVGYLSLASYHIRNKESAKALAIANEGLKGTPNNGALLELKGGLLAADKKYAEALKVYDELEKVAPARAIPLKIGSLVASKNIPKAVEQAQKLVAANPKSAAGHLVIASIYESQKDYDRAISAVRSGIAVEPGNLRASMALGGLYEKKRDFARAVATYDDILKKSPKNASAMFAKGAAFDQSGKKKEAAAIYRSVLKIAPDFVPALNNLAYLATEGHGSKTEALSLAGRANKLQPNNAGVMDTYGYALLLNGKRNESVRVLEKAVSLLPNNPAVHYHLAMAYREMGDRAKASASAQKSLQYGEFPESAAARKLLAELKR